MECTFPHEQDLPFNRQVACAHFSDYVIEVAVFSDDPTLSGYVPPYGVFGPFLPAQLDEPGFEEEFTWHPTEVEALAEMHRRMSLVRP